MVERSEPALWCFDLQWAGWSCEIASETSETGKFLFFAVYSGFSTLGSSGQTEYCAEPMGTKAGIVLDFRCGLILKKL